MTQDRNYQTSLAGVVYNGHAGLGSVREMLPGDGTGAGGAIPEGSAGPGIGREAAPALFKGELVGMEPSAKAGIIAILIGLRQADAFEFHGSGIITTNEHASSTLFDAPGADRILISTNENADSTVIAGYHAGGGWDPTSFDAPSGLVEQESFFF